ncbi:hypothetical protein [Arthrobacter sp. NPDC056493]|uniref:hypothetical protein n=1 Tax=Arthrobacter sp. NPDC056493 TaxID=3345839 RepID=UPI00366BD522
MVKLDVGAVVRVLVRHGKHGGYIGPMPTFNLAGVKCDYLAPTLEGDPEEVHSWEYGKWPRVEAAVPLTDGETVSIYAVASRWGHGLVHVSWQDDDEHSHGAWIPAANVRRLTASEWDIIEYRQCPPDLRSVRWGKRMPGFLPE